MPGVSYRVVAVDGTPIGAPKDKPFEWMELMFSICPDGSRYEMDDGGADPVVLKVRRNGVWHDWEPPLSEAQQAAYDAAMRGETVIITGPGGTGKSEVVRRIVRDLRCERGRQVAVTGSTGLAAVSIGGTTIHSFLGTGIAGVREAAQRQMTSEKLSKAGERIGATDVVVVDEISMLHGDYLDMAHWWMNLAYGNGTDGPPFAGKQFVFVGDFLQLPPVIQPDERIRSKYAFQAQAWKDANPGYYSLLHNYRQVDDGDFRKHLLRVRRGAAPQDTLDYFNARVGQSPPAGSQPTQLYPTNKKADAVNDAKLDALKAPAKVFNATYEGHPKWQEALRRNLPCEDPLELKVGAEVLCTYNKPDNGYINGTRGVVVDFADDGVMVQTRSGAVVKVVRNKWEMRNASDKPLAAVVQYPLRLAWAMTIHKSQGATLDELVFDPSGVFERAQAYVALSRVRTITGLYMLSHLRPEHVRASKIVVDWYRAQRDRMAGKP